MRGSNTSNTATGLDFYVDNYGAAGNGTTDDTTAFTSAIAGAAVAFSTVRATGKNYRINGLSINIPVGVTLKGTYNGMNSHSRAYEPSWGVGHDLAYNTGGSNLVITGGHNSGTANSQHVFGLATNATIEGFAMYWPNQALPSATAPIPYPWAIKATHTNNSNVRNIGLINAYNGVMFEQVHRGYIGGVVGQPLQTGIFCAGGGDVNRLENNHFGAMYSWQGENANGNNGNMGQYVNTNATAYKIGREDALNMDNCFAYGYGKGVHFLATPEFADNGISANPWAELTGCSFDACAQPIVVDAAQRRGVIIKGGQHINVTANAVVTIGAGFNGIFQMSDAYMLSFAGKYVEYLGAGNVSFDCIQFTASDREFQEPLPNGVSPVSGTGVDATNATGVLAVRGCTFNDVQKQVILGANLKRGIVTDNIIAGAENITNNMTSGFKIENVAGAAA